MQACVSRLVGSLCKVFPDQAPEAVPARLCALRGETVSFQVALYPGADGRPEESIRLMVLAEAFQDVRALYLLEGMIGRSAVLALIDREAGMESARGKRIG